MPDFNQIIEFVKQYYATWGYFFVPLGAFAENTAFLGLFFPGGTIILLGAFYAKLGVLSIPVVWALGAIGTFAGASLDFWMGRWGVHSLLYKVMPAKKLDAGMEKASGFMNKYGMMAIFLGHFIGHVRSFVCISAGTCGLSYKKFILYEGMAAIVWSSIYTIGGYILADNIDLLQRYLALFSAGAVALVILWIIVHFAISYWRRRTLGAEKATGFFSMGVYNSAWRICRSPFSIFRRPKPEKQETE